MKQFAFPIVLFFLAVQFVSCSGGTVTKEENWRTLDEDNYSITYPESWKRDTAKAEGVAFSFLSPQRGIGDNWLDNVSLVLNDISSNNWGLDSFVTYMEGELPSMIENLKILENERVENSNGDEPDPVNTHHRLLYTGNFAGKEIKFEQRFWAFGGTAYTLAYSATQKDYDWYKEEAEKMMNSFIIKDTALLE